MTIQSTIRRFLTGGTIVALTLLTGCSSKVNRAMDQAKSQAVSTNTPQQVQYVDGDGNTVTKTIQPPAAQGQAPAVSMLTTPPPPGPKPHSTDPVITPLGYGSQGAPAQGTYNQPVAGAQPAPAIG